MKIHFDGTNPQALTGPNVFSVRLGNQLIQLGHEIVKNGEEADVSLVFIEPSGMPLAKRVVQRLDGIWFKPEDFIRKNVGIKRLYETANAIVWQSKFDKDFTSKWWGLPRNRNQHSDTIRNGIDIKPVTKHASATFASLRSKYEKIFVCSANWHTQKRLKANIELFQHMHSTMFPNSALIVLGSHPDHVVSDPHIFYGGSVTEDIYMEVYSMADWMIHLAWLDHCPNTVIECLSQGTPIICSSDGGTKELGYSHIVKEMVAFKNQLTDYDNPPELDFSQVKKLPPKDKLLPVVDITIQYAASRYVALFERVLTSNNKVVGT